MSFAVWFFTPTVCLLQIYEAHSSRHQQWNDWIKMTTSTTKLQKIYNKQGFLSPLPVLSDVELREAKEAFSKLEDEFGT